MRRFFKWYIFQCKKNPLTNLKDNEYYEDFIFWKIGPINRKLFFILNASLVITFHVLSGIFQVSFLLILGTCFTF